MKVVALATTYPADQLTEAHLVLPSLEGITPDESTDWPSTEEALRPADEERRSPGSLLPLTPMAWRQIAQCVLARLGQP